MKLVALLLPLACFAQTTLNHVIGVGQSNMVGSSPRVTSSQPVGQDNKTLSTNDQTAAPLVGTTANMCCGESPNVAAVAELSALAGGGTTFQSVTTRHAAASTGYNGLKRVPDITGLPVTGTTQYFNSTTAIAAAKTAAESGGQVYRCAAVMAVHGESDNAQTAATYEGYLRAWANSYNYDCPRLAPLSPAIVPFFVSQVHGSSAMAGCSTTCTGTGPTIGQWQAARDYPGEIILVTPTYNIPFNADRLHFTPTGDQILGEYFGKALHRKLVLGLQWVPLAPRSITRSGATVTANFWVPVGDLVLDTSTLADHGTGKGFQFFSAGCTATSITGVSVAGGTATITLSGTPTGCSTEELCYACSATNTTATPGAADAIAGNLRDADTAVGALSGAALYNWAVSFREPIGFTWNPFSPTLSTTGRVEFSGRVTVP